MFYYRSMYLILEIFFVNNKSKVFQQYCWPEMLKKTFSILNNEHKYKYVSGYSYSSAFPVPTTRQVYN